MSHEPHEPLNKHHWLSHHQIRAPQISGRVLQLPRGAPSVCVDVAVTGLSVECHALSILASVGLRWDLGPSFELNRTGIARPPSPATTNSSGHGQCERGPSANAIKAMCVLAKAVGRVC